MTPSPRSVRERALHHILDAVGIGMAVSRLDYARKAVDGLGSIAASGPVPVIGFPLAWCGRDAATINGLICHGLDFDDTHLRGVIHPTVAQFPAAFSAAVMAGATTRQMLTAYILGVEASVRIASVARGGFHRCRLSSHRRLQRAGRRARRRQAARTAGRRIRQAQGIALSMASGTLEFLEDGAWTKRLHPGWAASRGSSPRRWQRPAMSARPRPIPAASASTAAFLGGDEGCDYALATAGLGETWELLETAIKPYPACHLTHGCIDAAIAIAAAHRLGPDEIASVEALVAADMVPTICEPIAGKRRPKNGYEAQFSIPFLVATALLEGRVTIASLEEDRLRDPAILAVAAKTGYASDPRSGYPKTLFGRGDRHDHRRPPHRRTPAGQQRRAGAAGLECRDRRQVRGQRRDRAGCRRGRGARRR